MEAMLANSKVKVGDNQTRLVKDVGSIPFITIGSDEKVISRVLYVPSLCKNLMSVSQMAKNRM